MLAQPNAVCNVKSFVMVQTGTYQEQHLRPFNVNINERNINALKEVTRDGLNLGVAAVQDVATDIIAPSANTEGQANIAHGWDSRRFRFIMVVSEEHPFIKSGETLRVFFGYTDHCDASFNHLDPNMRIYFNSETVIINSIEQTPAGPTLKSSIQAANQIITPVDVVQQGPVSFHQPPTNLMLRPEDVFNKGQTMFVTDTLNNSGKFDTPITMALDNRSMSFPGLDYSYSRRRDTSPTRYLSGTLNAFQHAVRECGTDTDSLEILYGESSSHSANSRMSSNPFISRLRDHCGYMENGFVTLADLQAVFPETSYDTVTQYAMDDGRSIRKVSHIGDSETWTGADNESVASSLIAQTIPSVMMDTFFRSVAFSATNGSGPNEYLIEFNPAMIKTLVNVSTELAQAKILELEHRIKTDILNIISRGNQIPFQMIVSSDLSGDTIIDMGYQTQSLTRYIAPTFSDSLFTPVLTRDHNLLTNISSDMIHLVTEVINPYTGFNANSTITPYVHPVAEPVYNTPQMQGNINDYPDLGLL